MLVLRGFRTVSGLFQTLGGWCLYTHTHITLAHPEITLAKNAHNASSAPKPKSNHWAVSDHNCLRCFWVSWQVLLIVPEMVFSRPCVHCRGKWDCRDAQFCPWARARATSRWIAFHSFFCCSARIEDLPRIPSASLTFFTKRVMGSLSSSQLLLTHFLALQTFGRAKCFLAGAIPRQLFYKYCSILLSLLVKWDIRDKQNTYWSYLFLHVGQQLSVCTHVFAIRA